VNWNEFTTLYKDKADPENEKKGKKGNHNPKKKKGRDRS
jgi:hypothetical protein